MKKAFIVCEGFNTPPFRARLLIMASAACIPILLCAFTGCETTEGEEMLPYNAIKGVGGPIEFKEDFLKANRIYEVLYRNENGELEWELDKTLPKFRTFIITEKARLDEIFSVCPDIDFEKDMVVISSVQNNFFGLFCQYF